MHGGDETKILYEVVEKVRLVLLNVAHIYVVNFLSHILSVSGLSAFETAVLKR